MTAMRDAGAGGEESPCGLGAITWQHALPPGLGPERFRLHGWHMPAGGGMHQFTIERMPDGLFALFHIFQCESYPMGHYETATAAQRAAVHIIKFMERSWA